MTTTHLGVAWFGGDDWQINATLLDENGNPFDLSSGQVKWCLLNAGYQKVLDESDVAIEIVDAATGQCAIKVPADKTSPLPGGKYSDAIRIVIGGITSTLSVGAIFVTADPWAAAVVPAVAMPRLRLTGS